MTQLYPTVTDEHRTADWLNAAATRIERALNHCEMIEAGREARADLSIIKQMAHEGLILRGKDDATE